MIKRQIDTLKATVLAARGFVPCPELQAAGQLLAFIERQKERDALLILMAWANDGTLTTEVRTAANQALQELET